MLALDVIRLCLLSLLFVAGAATAGDPIPRGNPNCNIEIPPPESGESYDHGVHIRSYPRNAIVPANYTGCQTQWVEIDGKWRANSKMYFVARKLAVWWRISDRSSPEGVYCFFEDAKLVAGPPGPCFVPGSAPMASYPPGCIGGLTYRCDYSRLW